MHAHVDVPSNVWTQLTDADVTAITVQNLSASSRLLIQRGGGTAPASKAGALALPPGVAVLNEDLATLFPGGIGARVWALSEGVYGIAQVSHV